MIYRVAVTTPSCSSCSLPVSCAWASMMICVRHRLLPRRNSTGSRPCWSTSSRSRHRYDLRGAYRSSLWRRWTAASPHRWQTAAARSGLAGHTGIEPARRARRLLSLRLDTKAASVVKCGDVSPHKAMKATCSRHNIPWSLAMTNRSP